MGMDVYGQSPTSTTGRYFRNSMGWWAGLAQFLVTCYPTLTAACEYWGSNDGDGLDAPASAALANAIDRDMHSGQVDDYAAEHARMCAGLPDHQCDLCEGTGVRTDAIGHRYGFDKPRDRATGRGGCNGCHGTGRQGHPLAEIPFSTDNVRAFAAFLHDCGGFQIW